MEGATSGHAPARTDLALGGIQDVMSGKQVILGTTGPGAATHDTPAALNAALGTAFKLVPGYDGIAKIQLALESREVDGYCVSMDAITIVGRALLDGPNPSGKIIVVMGSETPDHPWLKGVPAAETLAKTDEAKLLLRTVHAPSRISKPFAVAPGVPQDRVQALRAAMAAAFADPQFQDEAKKSNLEVTSSNGEAVTRIVRETQNAPPAVVTRLKDAIK